MNINYKQISQSLSKGLPDRTTDIIERRFGLKGRERETLESIGQSYKITRERVRQIEEEGLKVCTEKAQKYGDVFKYFNETLKSFGGIKKEDALLKFLGGDKFQNNVYFLISLGNDFKRVQDDDNFYSFWTNDKESFGLAKKAVGLVLNKYKTEKVLLPMEKLFDVQKEETEKALGRKIDKNIFSTCLELSKDIQQNHQGQLGLRTWMEINPRGIRDKAYLVLKDEGKPLHFTQVASYIDNTFSNLKKKAHIATVHNELIKDERFVLVGRGLYALKDWGYIPGVVKDVILKILKDAQKSLTKEEIAEKVMAQRVVKANTVLLNLQDKELFEKDETGKYKVREA